MVLLKARVCQTETEVVEDSVEETVVGVGDGGEDDFR